MSCNHAWHLYLSLGCFGSERGHQMRHWHGPVLIYGKKHHPDQLATHRMHLRRDMVPQDRVLVARWLDIKVSTMSFSHSLLGITTRVWGIAGKLASRAARIHCYTCEYTLCTRIDEL